MVSRLERKGKKNKIHAEGTTDLLEPRVGERCVHHMGSQETGDPLTGAAEAVDKT